jgi:hypothetical protein
MTTKARTLNDNEKPDKVPHPGMMGDGTEEQNLDEPGNPEARISKNEVKRAFSNPRPAK